MTSQSHIELVDARLEVRSFQACARTQDRDFGCPAFSLVEDSDLSGPNLCCLEANLGSLSMD